MTILLKQTNLRNLRMQKNDVYIKKGDIFENLRSKHTVARCVIDNWIKEERAIKL
jgi:hypothetical protein